MTKNRGLLAVEAQKTLGDSPCESIHGALDICRILDLLFETKNFACIDRSSYPGHSESNAPSMWRMRPPHGSTSTTSNRTTRSERSGCSIRNARAAATIRRCFGGPNARMRLSASNRRQLFTSTKSTRQPASHTISTSPHRVLKFCATMMHPFFSR